MCLQEQAQSPLEAKIMRITGCSILRKDIPAVFSFPMFQAGVGTSVGLICGNIGRKVVRKRYTLLQRCRSGAKS